jgi:hypothetical protein
MVNIFHDSMTKGGSFMGHFVDRKKWVAPLLFVLLLGVIGMGCSSTVKRDEPPASPPPPSSTVSPAPTPSPPTAPPPEITSWRSVGKYYYFDDILIPKKLEYDQKRSYVYETPQFKAGALYFTQWEVDTNSLFDFFLIHMERDGWKMVSSYRGKESHLTFHKPDRGCTIRITESWLREAHVEIRVGPADVKRK